ncbi:MAG: hypothetical protein JWO76_1853 [Nocardioides sp.]|nr:hypothetical protein [Nocardioides sp.]
MRLAVEGGGYTQACEALYSGNHDVGSTMLDLSSTVDGGASMAGGDTCGQAWAQQYDPAAAKALEAGAKMADAFARLANLTNASLVNHKAADGGALLSPSPYSQANDGDHDPDHWSESISLGTPPSAYGGTGDEPGWWHWISGHVGGWFWPDADTGRLRSVGAGWQKAADAMNANADWADSAIASLEIERSPEISVAVRALRDLKTHCAGLGDAFHELGQACLDYADDVDAKHEEIEHELTSFIEWTVGIELGGAILGAFTLGAGEGAAQAAEAAEVANAASKVIGILTKLLELAKAAATAVGAVVARIGEIVADLGRFLTGTREVAAVERAGAEAAKAAASRGAWTKVSEGMSDRAAAYQEQITGHSADESFVLNGIRFDGIAADGTLIDAKGLAYERFVKDGEFLPWCEARQKLLGQAERQTRAAEGAPITWHVAHPRSADAIENLLASEGYTNIHIVFTAPK